MGCCGKSTSRPRLNRTAAGPRHLPPASAPATPAPRAAPPGGRLLEYVGPTRLMVRGPITGTLYRFGRSRALVAIDERDAPFLLAVPNLRPAP